MSLRAYIVKQFERPHGMVGRMAGWIMATRPSNRQRNEWAADLLNIGSDAGFRILEIGCGPGLGLAACLQRARNSHVTGLDHSSLMIAQAAKRLDKAIRGNRAELWMGDLSLLPRLIADRAFDRIYSINVVQFLPERDRLFQIVYNCLAPGGVAATTYQPRHKNATRHDALRMGDHIAEAMTKVGFVQIRVQELSLRPAPAICVLGEKNF